MAWKEEVQEHGMGNRRELRKNRQPSPGGMVREKKIYIIRPRSPLRLKELKVLMCQIII